MLRSMGTLQEALPAGLAAAVLRLLPPLAVLSTGELAAAGSGGGGGLTGGSTKPACSMLRLESVQAGDAAPCRSLMAPCTESWHVSHMACGDFVLCWLHQRHQRSSHS